MRLICPNCAAQYEIDAALIPAAGRDVQCSSCGRTWFEHGAGAEAPERPAAPPGAKTGAETGAATPDQTVSCPEPETTPPPASPAGDAAHPDPDDDRAADPSERPGPPGEGPRRELDPRARAILLEEAERETTARRAGSDRTPLDFGLAAAPPRADAAPAPPRTAAPAPVRRSTRPPESGARSNALLPDIAEINSTLTPRPAPAARPPRPAAPRKAEAAPPKPRGIGLGFWLASALVVLLGALYLAAPALSAALPALEPPLAAYVEAVDRLRAAMGAS